MSLNALAEWLDTQVTDQHTLITESDACLVVCELSAAAAQHLARCCAGLAWACELVDGAGNAFAQASLCADFAPFRATVHKVLPASDGALYLLTASGFADALERGHSASIWRLARSRRPLLTQARVYGDWHQPLLVPVACPTRSPRALVRETGSQRRVPEDVRFWLLDDACVLDASDPLQRIWATKAFDRLSLSLANEIDGACGSLIFRGPPTLRLSANHLDGHAIADSGFQALQHAARWVFELGREAQLRHAMLATEIARAGRDDSDRVSYLRAHLGHALEGAKAVYQLHLSGITLDMLEALSTLRSNVSDDAARTTEATQQALTKVAAALGVGLTVMATGIGNAISPWAVLALMCGACLYCGLEMAAGWRLISIRRQLRQAWQPRLYRFLPQDDYHNMVILPSSRSERVYLWTALGGLLLVIAMSLTVVVHGFAAPEPEGSSTSADAAPGAGWEAVGLRMPLFDPLGVEGQPVAHPWGPSDVLTDMRLGH